MIDYILALMGKKDWSTEKIRSVVSGHQTNLILFILKKGTPTERNEALDLLLSYKVDSPRLMKRLVHIVQSDFLALSQLAMKVLHKNEAYHPRLNNRIRKAVKLLEERLRRTRNKKLTAMSFHAEPHKGVLFDKSKMQNLERLRQQLKKGMR